MTSTWQKVQHSCKKKFKIIFQENENDLSPETPDSRAFSKEFTLRQAKMNRELQELNRLLEKKETLATQMTLNDDQMKSLRDQHEVLFTIFFSNDMNEPDKSKKENLHINLH